MNLKLFRYIIGFLLISSKVFAQDVFTLEEAIKIALEKNYSVLIVKNEQQIAKMQNNLGAAGMSPTVSVEGRLNSSRLNSFQVFTNGTEQDRPGATAQGIGSAINADWVIFDGLRMFAVKKRLNINENLSMIQLRQQMENTIFDVITAYYDVVRVNELIKASKQNIYFYEERRKIAAVRKEIGSDSKVELLLSKSDENKARSEMIQLELDLLRAKTQLNMLLSRSVEIDFTTTDTISINYNPSIEELKKSTVTGNANILAAKQNELIMHEMVKEVRSAALPQIVFNSSYIFTRTRSEAGFLLSNRQTGFNFGLSGRWDIFSGGMNNRRVKEMNIQTMNQRYFTEQIQLQVDGLAFISYQSFILNKKIVEFELQNLQDSKEVQEISLERYKIGRAALLETIETQKNLEDAQVRYINALYNIKIAEAELLRVNGTLLK